MAFADDGLMFVAERGGTVRVIRDGAAAERPALDLSSEIATPEGGLLAIALDPKFDASGLMYALYAASVPRGGLEFVVARFRFVDGKFAERAVLLDRVPAAPAGASGTLRIGLDGKLYVALDGAGDERVAGSSTTYRGKVLRLNVDGTTPDDQPRSSPIFSLAHPQPYALDWQPRSGHLWVVDRLEANGGRLSVIEGRATEQAAGGRPSYALPAGTGAASAVFYRGDLMSAFKDNLFIAAEIGRELIRLRFDPDNPLRVAGVERLLKNQIGPVRVVAEGRDGALYLASESALYRLAPP